MKTLKFSAEFMELILEGKKTTTWRLFDDKDIQVDDVLELINSEDGEPFAHATVIDVHEKLLKNIDDADRESYEHYTTDEEMYKKFEEYYPEHEVDPETLVKIIHFELIEE